MDVDQYLAVSTLDQELERQFRKIELKKIQTACSSATVVVPPEQSKSPLILITPAVPPSTFLDVEVPFQNTEYPSRAYSPVQDYRFPPPPTFPHSSDGVSFGWKNARPNQGYPWYGRKTYSKSYRFTRHSNVHREELWYPERDSYEEAARRLQYAENERHAVIELSDMTRNAMLGKMDPDQIAAIKLLINTAPSLFEIGHIAIEKLFQDLQPPVRSQYEITSQAKEIDYPTRVPLYERKPRDLN